MAEIRTPDVDDLLSVLAALDDPDAIFALLEDLFQGSFEVLGNLLEDLRERIADAEACVHRLYGARKFFAQARVIAVLLLGDPRIEEEQRTDERGKGEDERS